MNMFDEARAIRGTMELCKMTQSMMARQMGVSQSYVANKLRLLNFSKEQERRITESGISERHARAILRLNDERSRSELLEKVIERSLTVRECEALVELGVESEAPSLISRAEQLDRIDAFRKALKLCVETLTSNGIEAGVRTSYLGSKMFITVCIDDV